MLTMRTARRLRRRAGEGVTIVASILLALGLEAGWNYGKARVEEDRLLEALRGEFAGAATEIENDLAARMKVVEHLGLLQRVRSGGDLEADSARVIVDALLEWRIYTPTHAVFDEAVDSGRLQLIRSSVVRESLAAYDQQRHRLEVFDARERDFVADEVEPYLVDKIELDQILGADGEDEETRRLRSLLLTDDTLAGLAALKRQRTEEAAVFSRAVLRRIDAVLALLEASGDAGAASVDER
jgi:hypothetical protein